MGKRIALAVFLLLCAACVTHALCYYPHLPAQVPTNFNIEGKPHGWTPKTQFLIVYLLVVAGAGVFFPGSGLLISRMSAHKISIPNKDYWLAPERKQRSLDFIAAVLTWIGSATLLFVMRMFHSCYEAALGDAKSRALPLPGPWLTGGLYGAFLLISFAVIAVRFRKKEAPSA
jgi:uncharacterized membrane protein